MNGRNMGVPPLLEVKELHTEFRTGAGIVRAVDGISYTVDPGETVAIVGESGSGKSVGALSIMRLIPDPPGRITGGEVWFAGRDLMTLSEEEMRRMRGSEIGMVFQEPMTSLNPVLTIGRQITETLEQHRGMDRAAADQRAVELLGLVGIADASRRLEQYPHQLSGGMRQRIMIAIALGAAPRPAAAGASRPHRGPAARSDPARSRLLVPAALPFCDRDMRRGAAALGARRRAGQALRLFPQP